MDCRKVQRPESKGRQLLEAKAKAVFFESVGENLSSLHISHSRRRKCVGRIFKWRSPAFAVKGGHAC